MGWDDFTRWWGETWSAGEHVACCGVTGCGKTTFISHLLPQRKWVLALDAKGGDETLGHLERKGFVRVDRWPLPRELREQLQRQEPVRVIIGFPIHNPRTDRPKLRNLLDRALEGAFADGGWTIYFDELQLAADRRMMKLGDLIEEHLISSRNRKISVVSSFQRPANVPRSASEMSTYLAVWHTRDVDVVDRVAQMMGRDKREVRGMIRGLGPHQLLLVTRNPHEPVRATAYPPPG